MYTPSTGWPGAGPASPFGGYGGNASYLVTAPQIAAPTTTVWVTESWNVKLTPAFGGAYYQTPYMFCIGGTIQYSDIPGLGPVNTGLLTNPPYVMFGNGGITVRHSNQTLVNNLFCDGHVKAETILNLLQTNGAGVYTQWDIEDD